MPRCCVRQGFVQFRLSGSTHLDVESLNERLKSNGAIRMRHSMRPDEQFGVQRYPAVPESGTTHQFEKGSRHKSHVTFFFKRC